MQAWRVVRYGDFGFDGSLRVACSLPDFIQFVAVGLDMPSMAQASSSVRLYCSIRLSPGVKKPPYGGSLDADVRDFPGCYRVICFLVILHAFRAGKLSFVIPVNSMVQRQTNLIALLVSF